MQELLAVSKILLEYIANWFILYSDSERITTPQYIRSRLFNEATDSGRLEVLYNNEWGNVCKNGWKYSNALVACRQLGYSRYSVVLYVNQLMLISFSLH